MPSVKYLKAKAIERKKLNNNAKKYLIFALCIVVPFFFVSRALSKTEINSGLLIIILSVIILSMWLLFNHFAKKIELKLRAKVSIVIEEQKQREKQIISMPENSLKVEPKQEIKADEVKEEIKQEEAKPQKQVNNVKKKYNQFNNSKKKK